VDVWNRLTAFDGYTFHYDAEGNLTRKLLLGYDDLYPSWNSLGQMTGAWRYQRGTVGYGYDASGRRVRRTAPDGTITRYLYDGDDLLMELDAAGNPIRTYTYYPGVDQPHSVHMNGQTYYYAMEQPGHVKALIDASNNVVTKYDYTPWGEVDATGTVTQPLGYMAREYDETIGLYNVRARWYDPHQGRFVSEDPIGLAGGINPYAYAGNDPVNHTDPSGLCRTIRITTWEVTKVNGVEVSRRQIGEPRYVRVDCDDNDIGGGEGGGSSGAPGEQSKEKKCIDALMPKSAASGNVSFSSLSGTVALGLGGMTGIGVYGTAGGDFGTFRISGAAAGMDASVDLHAGRATSLQAFAGIGYNVCGGAGPASACVDGNSSGAVVSGGYSLGAPPVNFSASVTHTQTRSLRQDVANWICK
jgi:RHS repeat-associated protein